jgi:hypothetical protein
MNRRATHLAKMKALRAEKVKTEVKAVKPEPVVEVVPEIEPLPPVIEQEEPIEGDDYFKTLNEFYFNQLKVERSKCVKGNKSSHTRARKICLQLTKELKVMRTQILEDCQALPTKSK